MIFFSSPAAVLYRQQKLLTNVKQFINGKLAIDYLRDNAKTKEELPDIILLDINMPITDGWMFLENYCDLHIHLCKEIKIYMVSSSIAPEDINRAKSNPYITDYLTKPLSPEQFEEILSS
jgi:CheY-like chemotaxis protein